jgi:hypothetical protein
MSAAGEDHASAVPDVVAAPEAPVEVPHVLEELKGANGDGSVAADGEVPSHPADEQEGASSAADIPEEERDVNGEVSGQFHDVLSWLAKDNGHLGV